MSRSSWFSSDGDSSAEVLREDAERVVYRTVRGDANGDRQPVLTVVPVAGHPTPSTLDRLTREYELKDDLDDTWAARPLELLRESGQTILVLKDPGGEPLDRLLGPPMELGTFLRLAVALSAALGRLHERGLVHKDIKPTNVLVSPAMGHAWLTGFGIASRLPRERQRPEPPEFIAGTLAYMSPEQTGRMNRSIDSRSDLYSLGITLYQMLTGSLPFTASDPMEWIHFHLAKRPVPPGEMLQNVPGPISAIIMKLLAKTAEERYQTAAGLESDLRRGLAEWEIAGQVDMFQLGEHDTPDRLLIPEKLYGRASVIETMLASFNRVVVTGAPELVLVSGYSGIGKSAVVNELHKSLVPTRSLFASGKFDQYKRDVPYATLAQAFQSLIRQLLSKSEADLHIWRDAFRQALGPNGLLIVDLVPELKLIIGDQPPVPVLPVQDAQRRFQLVLRRFISVFAQPEHPLALFLDDLQWLDLATLDFLEDLLTQPDVRHLLLIGAYRDNEVDPTHPLMRKLEAIRGAREIVRDIVLAPLTADDLQLMISDSLRCEPERTALLTNLVHEKTIGNPFFAIQFMTALTEEHLLTFDRRAKQWTWNVDRIRAKGYTDNVADLLVGKLKRLPTQTQHALRLLACLGNTAEDTLLTTAYEGSAEQLRADLWEALRAGLVFHSEGTYRFLHDRVQEAVYSLIPEEARAPAHLRIGRLLASRIKSAEEEGRVFEIVNQLNRGVCLIRSADERARVARLNLMAGTRARASTAYASAREYLAAGRALLTDRDWEDNSALIFRTELQMAECELLTANTGAAEQQLSALAERATLLPDIAAVARLRLTLYTTLSRSDRAVEVGLEYLRQRGTDWSPHPTWDQVQLEYERIWLLLGERPIEELIDQSLMTDPEALATLDLLTEIVTPASFTDENLLPLVICRMVNLSLEHGNSDASCFAYVWFGIVAGPRFGRYGVGFRFGQLGHDLVEKRGLQRFRARTYLGFGHNVMPWTKHLRGGRDLIRRAIEIADGSGDLTFAAYSRQDLVENLIAAGEPLGETQREAESVLAFAQKLRFGLAVDIIKGRLCLVRTLRGLSRKFGSFDDDSFDEHEFQQHLAADPSLALPQCWYWIRKLQALFFAADFQSALGASINAEGLLWTSRSYFELTEHTFYSALSRAALWDQTAAESQHHFEMLMRYSEQIEVWATNCPENFRARSALVRAEIARIENRELDAIHLYEQAVNYARDDGFVHHEAIASETAGRFYLSRGLETNGYAHLANAADCFGRWGADGKVAQLQSVYPRLARLARREPLLSLGQLDVATVIRASQAVSSEIVLPSLIERLMKIALQNSGADRVLLLLPQKEGYRVEAEARASNDEIVVHQGSAATQSVADTIIHYVVRTRERVILDDASKPNLFAEDAYLRHRHARSLLCLPLMRQGTLVGLLYIENTLTTHAFTPERTAVLEVLAAQAAISLENSRLYGDLQDRESKIRRLVDANIIGIFIWKLEGQILEANDAFLHMVGYDREDLASGGIRWSDLIPPEWLEHDARQLLPELERTGLLPPFERDFFRKDGSRVPVLIGAASFEGSGNQGVAFLVDLSERKKAEERLRESERRYHEAQVELAHANRVVTLGQLSTSIAHEVNQPIAAAVTNASAALRWLAGRQPDLKKARLALNRIVTNGNRASEVIGRMRALLKRAPLQKEDVDINQVILDVITLTRGEATKYGISVQTQLAEGVPLIQGDRVQLQQVMLNLIINAVEAMSSVGDGLRQLIIRTEVIQSERVVVEVLDSGPGLTLAALERVFDAFYTTKPGGLGMGLSICRTIIEAHGGELWATANRPRGVTFQFTLPTPRQDRTGKLIEARSADGEHKKVPTKKGTVGHGTASKLGNPSTLPSGAKMATKAGILSKTELHSSGASAQRGPCPRHAAAPRRSAFAPGRPLMTTTKPGNAPPCEQGR